MLRYALNDRTTLEMTLFFLLKKVLEKTLFFSRHFDQTKCVEKSPKAKQYYLVKYLPLLSFRA